MKKTLIALAALAATAAFAQSSVSITGGLRLGVAKFADGSTGLATTQSSGNTINFTVVEDLGGGLSAEGAVQMRYDLSNGTQTNGGGFHTTRVGLSGGFGRIQMGRIGLDQHWGYTGFGSTSAGAAVMPVSLLGATENNQIRYISPNISGFQAHVAMSFKNGTPTSASNTFNGGTADGQQILLSYSNGPVSLLYVNEVLGTATAAAAANTVVGSPVFNTTTSFEAGARGSQLGGSYDLGVAKINVISGLMKTTDGSASGRNAFTISGTVPMGAMTIKAALKNDRSPQEQNVTALGLDYAFSKRTVAEVVTWKYTDAKANMWVGMRHSF